MNQGQRGAAAREELLFLKLKVAKGFLRTARKKKKPCVEMCVHQGEMGEMCG